MTPNPAITPEPLVRDLDDSLSAPGEHECLPCYLNRMVSAHGCDNHLRWAEVWRHRNNAAGLQRWLHSRGGYCDCEVLFNVYPEIWPEEEELTQPCLGVTPPGSTQPCRVWTAGVSPVIR